MPAAPPVFGIWNEREGWTGAQGQACSRIPAASLEREKHYHFALPGLSVHASCVLRVRRHKFLILKSVYPPPAPIRWRWSH
eukprot:3567925-Karenia_brevis.AAC.1